MSLTAPPTLPPPTYPAHWEADVLLLDGRTARVRPTRAGDTDDLVAFYARVSPESKYLRYFSPHPVLSEQELSRLVNPDYDREVSLVVETGGRIIALGLYVATDPGEAEVAFLVEDAHHGKGIGTILLEHLAQAARERGITKFIAEILAENGDMIRTLRAAGYRMRMSPGDGYLWFECEIEPTEHAVGVMLAREQRAEAVSMQRFFGPTSIAVIGASRRPGSIGWLLLRNLITSGYCGRLFAVNPAATAVLGMPAYASIRDIPQNVGLAVIALPADLVADAVADCAARGVHGLIVISSGFAETGQAGRIRQQALLDRVRGAGMRMIGPNCLGVINTREGIGLNASLSTVMPAAGRVGFFCQTGALGVTILETVTRRGLGLSTFVSAGNRADVSGNDLLHYWDEDPQTSIVLLYLESLGNARKFSRLARMVGRHKPVVAVRSGRRARPTDPGIGSSTAPLAAVDAMFRQAGVIQVDTLDAMFDVAQLLAYQPLPTGRQVAVIGNSDGLEVLATEAAWTSGLRVGGVYSLGAPATAADYTTALTEVMADDRVDGVVVLYASVVPTDGAEVAASLLAASRSARKPLVTTFLGLEGVPPMLRVDEDGMPQRGSVPAYRTPEGAVRAMARAVEYAAWLHEPQTGLRVFGDVHEEDARRLVARLVREHPGGVVLDDAQTEQLLGCYGIRLLPSRPVSTVEQAIEAGQALGWDVVLRAANRAVRSRMDIVHTRLHLDDAEDMRQAWAEIASDIDDMTRAGMVVQQMSAPGVPTQITCLEDLAFGPVISFAVALENTDLLGDIAYRIPPLTESDVHAMVRETKASKLFFNHRGSGWADVAALEDLVHRVSQLKDALPDVESVQLGRVLVGTHGASVVRATVAVRPNPSSRSDWYTRRLPGGDDALQPVR